MSYMFTRSPKNNRKSAGSLSNLWTVHWEQQCRILRRQEYADRFAFIKNKTEKYDACDSGLSRDDEHTSGYGATSAQEFFAEAVADVYTNGDKARKTSVAIVKEYEKRQKNLTRKKFFNKKAGIFRRMWNWIKF